MENRNWILSVNILKLNENAIIPTYAKPGDAGMDLVATSRTTDDYGNIVYGTGLAIEIPVGYVGLLFPRSSISKYDLFQTNSVGVVDSGYRGEIMIKFKQTLFNIDKDAKVYNIGERIGQIILIPYPVINFIEVDKLSETERGEGGYGSTGN